MSDILNLISDIRVVIAIAIVVMILSIWLIMEKVKYNRKQYKKNHVTHRYTGK